MGLRQITIRVRSHSWLEAVLVWLLFLSVHSGLLWLSGAFQAEFGEYPDESGHYVTGLMVRDYIASGAPSAPMRFAENYYLHYPKVALGHYPPFFYIVEAAWMLIFPVSRPSILVLLAVIVALMATLVHFVVRREFGPIAGGAAGLLLISTPLVQRYCGMVMSEPLCLLLVFSAALCFSRYLETRCWTDAAWFGVLASLAILTKQVALFLVFLPLMALLLARQLRLLLRPSFWLPALIVLVMAMPWYAFAHAYFGASVTDLAGRPFSRPELAALVTQFLRAAGFGLLLPMTAGAWARIIKPLLSGRPVEAKWAVWGALIVSFSLFWLMFPAAHEERHLLYIQPACVLLVVAGIAWLANSLPLARFSPARRAVFLSLVLGLVFGLETFAIPARRHIGFAEAAEDLVGNAGLSNSVFLVSADGAGEGAFIAELAAREKRPGHIVLRGTKMLAKMSWSGGGYRLRYKTSDEVAQYLESVPVGVLVVELNHGQPQMQHERLVLEMLPSRADRWKLIGTYPRERRSATPAAEVRAYRLVGAESKPPGRIRVDVTGKLRRFIEN